jgi:2,3-bisphosphoglycerate-independent phosphoglycerate mutase
MTQKTQKQPLVLLILDGWGYREATDHNAIYHADTPTWDQLWQQAPHTLISSSGPDVGLPEGQMGNSEVGHMSLGAGRVIYQNITRIGKSIQDRTFFDNPAYNHAIAEARRGGGAVHIMGLLSPGGVHSHEDHLLAMIELAAARGCEQVYLHAFLDGRDTPPRSAGPSLARIEEKFAELRCGRIASITGRFYAMDRDNRWERVEPAWRLLTEAEAPYRADDALQALQAAYDRNESDEFVQATRIQAPSQTSGAIKDGDAVIFMNFRSDRSRQLSRAFTNDNFDGFIRKHRPKLASFVTTTPYADDINAEIAFPSEALKSSLGEYLAHCGRTQLRIAETEKYAHVTFFFSGGREALFPGESRILVDSPKVTTYDLQPQMSAPEVTDKLVTAITSGDFDVIICNYANGDMVGHTGVFSAAIEAVEAIDNALSHIVQAVNNVGGECLITADHGNCEQMQDQQMRQHTQHTTEPVPLIYVGPRSLTLRAQGGTLADVAPTMLELLDLPQPEPMSGHSLICPQP